jgi:CheY-like chemotaxis protein
MAIYSIDDNEDILYTYDTLLKKGHIVHAYSNPAEDLKHIKQVPTHNYDFVIMDIMMSNTGE